MYFNHPPHGNSTNYYLILGLRDEAAPPTSQQINKFPPKRVKNLATPSSILILILFSSSTEELCSQPIRSNDRPIGRMFPKHVERRFLDPEYSFDEYFQLGSRRKVRPIKNGLSDTHGIHSVTMCKRLWSAMPVQSVSESVPVVSQGLWSVSACGQSVPVVSQCPWSVNACSQSVSVVSQCLWSELSQCL